MAVQRSFLVKLVGDAKQLINEFQKTEKASQGLFGKDGLGGKLKDLLPSFKTIAVAGTAAFGALSAAAGFAVKAAAEEAEGMARLSQALKTTFGESEQLVAATEEFIASMQRAAAVGDGELRPAMTTLIRATGDMSQSQKLLKLALDISAGSGRDLESVTIALARASQGSVTALTRMGVPLDQNAVKAKDFDAIVAQLSETFDGAAAASAESAQGKFRAFGLAVEDLQEQFGFLLLPALTKVVDYLTKNVIPAVALAIEQFSSQGVRAGLAYFVASFGNAGKAVIEQMRGVALAIVSLGDQIRPVAALIGLSLAPVIGFTKAWDLYNNIIKGSADATNAVNKAFDSFGASVDYATKKLDIISQGPMDKVERQLAQSLRTAKGAKVSLDEFGDGAEQSGRKAGKSAEKVKSAADRLKEYTSVLKSAQSASKSFGDSQRRVGEAALSVAEADEVVAAAQAALLKAQQAGSPGEVADAQRALAAAERGLARAKFGQEESIMAVRDAERKLAEVRGDPASSPDVIRRAEIDLAEAKFRVADAEDNQIDVSNRLAEARRQLRIATEGLREGDRELIPLQDAVTRAQEAQTRAAERHAEALEAQTEALDKYRESLQALGKTAEMFPRIAGRVGAPNLIPLVPSPAAQSAADAAFARQLTEINIYSTIADESLPEKLVSALRTYNRTVGPLEVQVI